MKNLSCKLLAVFVKIKGNSNIHRNNPNLLHSLHTFTCFYLSHIYCAQSNKPIYTWMYKPIKIISNYKSVKKHANLMYGCILERTPYIHKYKSEWTVNRTPDFLLHFSCPQPTYMLCPEEETQIKTQRISLKGSCCNSIGHSANSNADVNCSAYLQ